MNRSPIVTSLTGTLLVLLFVGALDAAEIRLRAQCQPPSHLLLLGDVAEIFSSDAVEAQRLQSIELMPTPSRVRYLRIRELQDLLHVRGVNLGDHHFSGASQVEIGVRTVVQTVAVERSPTSAAIRSAEQTARAAVDAYFTAQAGQTQLWQIDLQLEADEVRAIDDAAGELRVSGGQPPWSGMQQLVLHVPTGAGEETLPVSVNVSLPISAVVAVRAVPRGAVVQATDLEVSNVQQLGYNATAETFSRIEDVVGQETTRALAVGQVLDQQDIQAPILIRNGEVVTVYARNAGVQVRTTARARDSGSLGDLITVEALHDRSRFYARVSGPQVVDVYARGISLGKADPAPFAAAEGRP